MITVWRCTERKKRWTSYNDYDATIQQWRWSQCFSPKMVMVQRHILQSVYLQPLIIIYVPIRLCKSRVSRITIYHMRQRQSERVREQALNVIFCYAIVSLKQIQNQIIYFNTSASTNSVIHIYKCIVIIYFFLSFGIDVELYECAYKYKGAGKSRQRVHTYTYSHIWTLEQIVRVSTRMDDVKWSLCCNITEH